MGKCQPFLLSMLGWDSFEESKADSDDKLEIGGFERGQCSRRGTARKVREFGAGTRGLLQKSRSIAGWRAFKDVKALIFFFFKK